MDMLLKGKRALITGSTSAIGAQCARVLAGEGVSVVINGRSADRAAAVTEEIRKVGGEAKFVLGDVTTEDGSNAVIEGAKSAFDGIDILVNNVGNPTQESHDSWFDAPFQEWIDDYHQNTIAAVRLVPAFTPAMKERGWGRLMGASFSVLHGLSCAKSSKNSKANRIETGETSGGIRRNLFGGSRRKLAKKIADHRPKNAVKRRRRAIDQKAMLSTLR